MNKNELSDIELYNDYINGNENAFNILVDRYRKKLISYIKRYIKNPETAEDISQEVFIYMFNAKKKYDFKYKFETYLYRIAKSRTINLIRKLKNEIYLDEINIIKTDYNNDIDSLLIKKEEIEQLLQMINNLKDDYKEVIYLKYLQGLNYKEICSITGKNIQQVKSLLHRARKILRNMKKL